MKEVGTSLDSMALESIDKTLLNVGLWTVMKSQMANGMQVSTVMVMDLITYRKMVKSANIDK